MQIDPDYIVLTGAGISAESGIQTFRDSDGLWEGHHVEDVASPEGFKRNAQLVYEFYNQRRAHVLSPHIKPNKAHIALAELAHFMGDNMLLVTQNVDPLHEIAGHHNVHHMHGELLKARCQICSSIYHIETDFDGQTTCQSCGKAGGLRPDIVWFGEMPFFLPEVEASLTKCRYFISIGTSGHVYPAAGFVQIAKASGAHCLELNLEQSQNATIFDDAVYGCAGDVVPKWCQKIMELKNAGKN